jgi:2-dehydro-3-deoxyphosphooctonate aldolase (KDO 8-P synthase)
VPRNPAQIGPYSCGSGQPLLWIAGPCVLEDLESALQTARELKRIAAALSVQLVFKASFDKANRTSVNAFRGPGLKAGLQMLADVQADTGLPVTTDIHEPSQAAAAGEICQVLQIPAFLARQTDLLAAAGRTGKAVHVKKGQFMAPGDMRHVVKKLAEVGCEDVLLCERGTFFG